MGVRLFIFLAAMVCGCKNDAEAPRQIVKITSRYEIGEVSDYLPDEKIVAVLLKTGRVGEEALRGISNDIRRNYPDVRLLTIVYSLRKEEIGLGAWARATFDRGLKIELLCESDEALRRLYQTHVGGNVLGVWELRNTVFPQKVFLVEERGNLVVKSFSTYNPPTSEIVQKSISKTGLVQLDCSTLDTPQYYQIGQSGNLSVYVNGNKWHELTKVKLNLP